ncbi:MAG: hypothetical protein NTW25_14705 [Candidatus Kapabacteria bacterium]|nr:hypothetical protein [Candidatus Kapabacteria bacterium]
MRLLFLIFIFSINLFAQIDTEKFVRLNVDLNGVLKAENKIFIYGSNGSLLISEDNAKSWKHECIGDSINIIDFKYIDGNLKGICTSVNPTAIYDFKYNLSDKTTSLIKIKYIVKDFTQFSFSNNVYYFAKYSTLFQYNTITKTASTVISSNNFKFNYFTIIDKYILIPTTEKIVLRYDIDSKQIDTLKNKFNLDKAHNIVTYKNNLYTLNNSILYKSKDYGSTWDSLGILENSSLYESNKNLYNTKSDSINGKGISIISNDGLSFNFENKSNCKFKSYFEKFQIENIFEIDSNLTIAVGQDKTIFKSQDNSISWDLLSNLTRIISQSSSVNFSNKDLGVLSTEYKQFYKTSDGGSTWLPSIGNQKISTKNSMTYTGYNYLDNNGAYFYLFQSNLDSSAWLKNFFYSFDTCNSFKTNISNPIVIGSDSKINRIIKIKDSIHFVIQKKWYINHYSILYNTDLNFKEINYHNFDSLIIYGVYQNSENNLEMICNEARYHKEYPKILGYTLPFYDSAKVIIKVSKDNSKTWENKIVFPELNKFSIFDFVTFNKKLYFLTKKEYATYIGDIPDTYTYLYEVDKDKYKLIHTFNDSTVVSIVNIGGKLHYFSLGIYYFQNENNEWKSQAFTSFIGNTYSPLYKYGNIHYVAMKSLESYDANYDYKNIYKYIDESPASDVEAQIEEMTDLVTLNPSPLPANIYAKIGVIWSPIYKFDLTNIEVYDIYGVKVKSNLKTSLREYDTFRGELTIQTEDLPEGVFFVKISHGITTKYVKILVSH